ncbi:MAG: DUF2177 family protein [Bradymonadia bacterium]
MRALKAFFAVTAVMVVLDYLFLGHLARGVYKRLLGPLLGETVLWAAVLFYLQYVAVIIGFAVLPSRTLKQACLRGLGIGWLAYATYELTNMAVISGWPAQLILIDICWGLVLTTTAAGVAWLVAGPPAQTL